VARRRELDASILELARKAGAEVLDGTPCTGARPRREGVEVEGSDGDVVLMARHVIGADGAWSPLRRHLGASVPGYRGEWHAFRQYFVNVGPEASSRLFAWFEPDFLPGYAWSFPVADGVANVGFGIWRGGQWRVGAMGALWREILARPHIREVLGPDAIAEGPHRAWPIPAAIGAQPLTVGRALFVGDAAAAADPLTGEGIGQALATGTWAAESILSATRGSAAADGDAEAAARAYRQRVKHELAADHKMSELLSRAMSHRRGARTAIRLASLTPWTRRNFARWLFEDYPRAMTFTPRRWHRGMFSGPGAFRS
jgi:flavin-dependent dehydrogenase